MEGDVGAGRLNPNETEDSASEVEREAAADETSTEATDEADLDVDTDAEDAAESTNDGRSPSRLGRGWLVGIAAALVVLAGGLGASAYFVALRSHQESEALARRDEAALAAAKDCVTATQAPDTQAMATAAQKMIECGTGAYRSQAILYSSLLVEAYQAA